MKNGYRGLIAFMSCIISLLFAWVFILNFNKGNRSPAPLEVITPIEVTVTPTVTPTNVPTATPTPTPTVVITQTPTAAPVEEAKEDEVLDLLQIDEPTAEPTKAPAEEVKEPKKKITKNAFNTDNVLYEVHESYGTYMLEAEYQDYTYQMCEKYGVTKYYKLMLALMWHESNYNVNEISKTNDYGLCQINTCNHGWLKKTLDIDPDFLNPYTSIECGVYMLSSYLKKYDDVHKALVAYNKGDNAVDRNKIYESTYSRVIVNILENKLFEVEREG